MLKPEYATRFKKDFKNYKHNQAVKEELDTVLKYLLAGKKLPEKYSDHSLTGPFVRYRECHVRPDVLLVYRTDEKYLYLARIGSHSKLF